MGVEQPTTSFMQKALLLYNPQSGRRRQRRLLDVQAAAAVLRSGGVEVETEATQGPATGGDQARRAGREGYDTIITCGGDGTIHDVLQGMVNSAANLGVIPLGTGNALGNDLGLPRNPAVAARMLLTAVPQPVAVGRIEVQRGAVCDWRYFIVTAGIGVDAELLYSLSFEAKRWLGMAGYYGEALRQWAVQKFPWFDIEFYDAELGRRRQERVTQLLAVRITHFGGVLRKIAPGASLLRRDFQLVLFKTPSRTRYLRFVLGRMLNRYWSDPFIEFAYASEVCCYCPSQPSPRIYAEADGEVLGTLPVSITVVPDAVSLLVPARI